MQTDFFKLGRVDQWYMETNFFKLGQVDHKLSQLDPLLHSGTSAIVLYFPIIPTSQLKQKAKVLFLLLHLLPSQNPENHASTHHILNY